MHERIVACSTLSHLLAGGLLVGAVDEMLDANLGHVFTPHGLGHLIGVDTHECAGNRARALCTAPVPLGRWAVASLSRCGWIARR